jgi:hypothetical protein
MVGARRNRERRKRESIKMVKWLERPIALADDSLTIVPWSSRELPDAML